jgi:enoyl-CoA hydratase
VQAVFDVHSTGHGNAISVAGAPILVGLDEMKGHLQDGKR